MNEDDIRQRLLNLLKKIEQGNPEEERKEAAPPKRLSDFLASTGRQLMCPDCMSERGVPIVMTCVLAEKAPQKDHWECEACGYQLDMPVP